MTTRRRQLMLQDLLPGLINQGDLEWERVASVRYLIRQSFRYDYDAPISNLRHRLMIVPPDQYGDQRTVVSNLRVFPENGRRRRTRDAYGNVVDEIEVDEAPKQVEFDAWVAVDRSARSIPNLIPVAAGWANHPGFLEASGLTEPGPYLRQVAREIASSGLAGPDLADAVNAWVHERLQYRYGVTDVGTPAAESVATGAGVCQDYAQVMLALCRVLGLPSRYVSGHLLGEGGTHAWVEVLTPEPAGGAVAIAYDPTHGRRTNVRYVTVAVGRDYRDVAPTSGSYSGGAGILTARKRVDIVGVEYAT